MSDLPVAAEPTPVTVVEETKPSMEDTMTQVYEKNYPESRVDRSKDSGQFKSKEAEAPEGAEVNTETGDTEVVSDQEPVAETKETAEPSIPRPQSWSSDVDELWAKLPPESKEFIAKRESDAHKKITELGTLAQAAEKYDATLRRYQNLIGNTPPEREIENLLATKAALLRDPVGSLQWLAQQLNVDLTTLAPQQANGNFESPELGALHREIATLKQQLYGVTNQITTREQSELAAREQTLTESIEKFSKDPTRASYWDDVEPEVLNQVYALKASNPQRAQAEPMSILKDAYDRAVLLNPEVKAKMDKTANDKAAAEKSAEAKKKADEAKKLASINVRSQTGSSPKNSHKSIEAEMEEIYDRMRKTG